MKYYIALAASLLFIGAGCAGLNPTPTENATPSNNEQAVTSSQTETSTITIPDDAGLLPKNRTWRSVTMKNFDHPYMLEIHPYWHWNGSDAALKGDGAVFATSESALNVQAGNATRVVWGFESAHETDTLDMVMASAGISQCDVLKKTVNGFEVCAGHIAPDQVQAVAFQKANGWEWTPFMTYGQPADQSLGNFLHMIASFKETSKK